MKSFLKFLSPTLLGVSLLLASCGGSNSEDPAPKNGSIEGKITPSNSVTAITATDDAKKTFSGKITSGGDYSIADLVAGSYKLTFTPAQGYTAPAEQTVTVKAGEVTKVADITVAKNGGKVSWTVDGKTTAATFVLGTLYPSNLTVIGSNSANGQSVTFNLSGFAGKTGTFTAGGFETSTLMFSQSVGNTASQWTASFLGGNGTMKVTSLSTNPRRCSGTFSGTLTPAASTTFGNKSVTGTFTDVLY